VLQALDATYGEIAAGRMVRSAPQWFTDPSGACATCVCGVRAFSVSPIADYNNKNEKQEVLACRSDATSRCHTLPAKVWHCEGEARV